MGHGGEAAQSSSGRKLRRGGPRRTSPGDDSIVSHFCDDGLQRDLYVLLQIGSKLLENVVRGKPGNVDTNSMCLSSMTHHANFRKSENFLKYFFIVNLNSVKK